MATDSVSTKTTPKQEHWLASLLFNIVIPITILNKLSAKLGPANALILALAFPLCYGAYTLIQTKKISPVSVLGLLNVSVTGGFALSGLTGFWFAVKEAAFPALVGIFVFASSWSKRPFMESLLLNPQVMKVEALEARLKEISKEKEFHHLLQNGTRLLSLSFFLSALLNFILANRIFLELDPNLSEQDRSLQINSQIAEMTGWSALVIVVPSMIFMGLLMAYLFQRLQKITGQSWQEFMQS